LPGSAGAAHISGNAGVAEGDGARAALGDSGVMGHDENGGVEAVVQIVDEAEDFGAGVGVEVAGGLVGEEDGRLESEGSGDGDALAFASGKLVGQVVEALAEAHKV